MLTFTQNISKIYSTFILVLTMSIRYCIQVSRPSGISYVSGFSINYSGGRIKIHFVSRKESAIQFTKSDAAATVATTVKRLGYHNTFVVPFLALGEAA